MLLLDQCNGVGSGRRALCADCYAQHRWATVEQQTVWGQARGHCAQTECQALLVIPTESWTQLLWLPHQPKKGNHTPAQGCWEQFMAQSGHCVTLAIITIKRS